MKTVFIAGLCLAATQMVWAQDGGKQIVGEMVKHYQASKALSLAVAEAMPEDLYSFKATDGEMTFGEQMNHIAAGAELYCGVALKAKSPLAKPADAAKPTAIKALTGAYDYCIEGLQGMTDAGLQKSMSTKMGEVTPFELFWGGFTHSAHHRGQAEVYLRLKGITPPAYKF